jgi:hypothetical protein
LLQGIIRFVESRRLIHVRRAKQSPIQRVRPRVIRALNRCGVPTSFFAKSRAAVAAHVVKGADRRSLIFRDDQAFAGHFRKKIVAGFGELGLMPDQHPLPREYLLQLFGKNLWRNKKPLTQRLRAGLKSFPRFAEVKAGFGLCDWHGANSASDASASIWGAHAASRAGLGILAETNFPEFDED